MVNLETGLLHRDGVSAPIKKFLVWFRTPFGITSDLQEAVQVCAEQELSGNRAIQPIVVAIDETQRYEEVIR